MFSWVRAVRNYYYVYRQSEPFRDKAVISEIQSIGHEKLLKAKQKEILKLSNRLECFREEFMEKEVTIRAF